MSNRPLITLTTDFGEADYHLPRLRARLLTALPDAQLVDVTHAVPTHDIVYAAQVLDRCWHHFPVGSLHLVSVYDYYHPSGRFIAFQRGGHYFVGPDNGIFSLLFEDFGERLHIVTPDSDTERPSAIYARAAALALGGKWKKIGPALDRPTQRLAFQPVMGKNYIRGTVTFIDRYDNLTTNISRHLYERVGKGRGFRVLSKRMTPIDGLSRKYHDVPTGEALCRFNGEGFLEISINTGRAASLLGIGVDDTVQLEFE